MLLTQLTTAALAAYTVTGGITTVDNLADLTSALADSSVTEIIVSQTITLPTGTVLGGSNKTVRAAVTGVNESGIVQAGSNYSVFTIASGAAVSISNLTIMGGSKYAIYNSSGTLTMKNVIVTHSGSATTDGRGNCSGGGIYNGSSGKLILTGCSIVRNVAAFGGGMLNDGGTVVMDGCSLSENRSLNSSGGGAAENRNRATMYINNSVISNNTSSEIGGGINNYNSYLYLMNTTVTGNATTAAPTYGGGIGNNGGRLYAVNSIITDNYYCASTSSTSSDIGYGGSNYLYYCVYGTLRSATLSDNIGNKTNTDGVFAKYRLAGILSGSGTMTASTYNHPVLASASGLLYAPLAVSGSPAATGGVYATYFDYSALSAIKMSYRATESGTETTLGSLAKGGTQVTGYIEASGRGSGVIGASSNGSGYSTVAIAPSANGSVSGGTVYGDTYSSGETVTITAVPNNGYYFEKWTNANDNTTISYSNSYTFTATSDITVKPNFTITPTCTVTLNPSVGISGCAASENGTDYEPYCGPYTVTTGGSLYIKANTETGYVFTKWTDNVTANPYKLENITANVSYTPTAALPIHAVTPVITTALSTEEVFCSANGSVTALDAAATVTDGGNLSYDWYSNDGPNYDTSTKLNVTTATYAPPAIP